MPAGSGDTCPNSTVGSSPSGAGLTATPSPACASTSSTRRGSATGFLDRSTPSTGGELMKRTQRGMTLMSFIIVLAVVGFAAYIGMKLFSMYSEYYSVRQALKGLQAEPGIAKKDPAKIKNPNGRAACRERGGSNE